jgi:hypothetical protein
LPFSTLAFAGFVRSSEKSEENLGKTFQELNGILLTIYYFEISEIQITDFVCNTYVYL